jgi:hypothetical protein
MSIVRNQIIKGPAKITYRGATFFSRDDVNLELGYDTFDIASSAHGKVDERAVARRANVSFTPIGEWTDLAVLWPYGSFNMGQSIFHPPNYPSAPNTGADQALVIHSIAGEQITLHSAAITQMPDLDLSAQRTAIGNVSFSCIGSDNVAWETANSLMTVATVAFNQDDLGLLNLASIKTVPITAVWAGAAAPWDAIQSISGFRVSFNLATNPIETDTDGVVDMIVANVGVQASFQPLGVTETELVAAMSIQGNTAVKRGASMQALGALTGTDLTLSGPATGDPEIALTEVFLKSGGISWGAASPRMGQFTFIATRTFVGGTGAPDPLFTVGSKA